MKSEFKKDDIHYDPFVIYYFIKNVLFNIRLQYL